jgi:uncharacterized RmlC-like cupin family protein
MATIVRTKDLKDDKAYEPPYSIGYGISKDTVENSSCVMGRTIIPPGARNQRHYHVNCDAAIYTVRGRRRLFVGPSHEMKEYVAEPGDFIYVPKGEIHGSMNLSDTEPCEVIFCYIGVGSKEEAKTIKVEPPWE